MTAKDIELLAGALADTERITEDADLNGVGSSTLRLAVNLIGAAIKAQHPRFNTGAFQIAALPIQSERQKQAILKVIAADESRKAPA